MGDVPYDFGAAWMAGCLTKEKFMPERNVIGGMDRVGITVLEDVFDAKPMYDTSDEATNRSQVSKAEAMLGLAPSTALVTCRRRGFIFEKRWRTGQYLADKNLIEN
jgi:hypothetical protein